MRLSSTGCFLYASVTGTRSYHRFSSYIRPALANLRYADIVFHYNGNKKEVNREMAGWMAKEITGYPSIPYRNKSRYR